MTLFAFSAAPSRAAEPNDAEAADQRLGNVVSLPGASAGALRERLARKAAKLKRRHLFADIVRQYIAANPGGIFDRDPGRLTPLRFFCEVFADEYADAITADMAAEALTMYAECPVRRFMGRDEQGQPIYRETRPQRAPATVNRAKVALSATFNHACAESLLPDTFVSPTRALKGKGFNAAQLPDRALTPDQVETLLAHARTAPWNKLYLYVLLSVTTGARTNEVRQLRGRNIVLDGDNPHAIIGIRRREGERSGTKNGDAKVMPLSPAVVAEIRRWGVPGEDDLLFPSARKPGQPFATAAAYRKLMLKIGVIENRRPHDLRHTAGTFYANEGRSGSEIAALLGHRTLTMVSRYTRVQPHAKARAFNESALARLK